MSRQLYSDWNEFWEKENITFLGKIMTRARMKAYWETVTALDVDTVIDVGCGFGMLLRLFERAGLAYEGIDVSPNAIAACREHGLNARLGKLEEETGSYDLVESEGMLEHFLNFEPFAEHLMRISRRYVLIMQPNHDSFCGKTLVYLAQLLRSHVLMYEYNYRMKDFIAVFAKHGFSVVKNHPVFFDTSRLLLFEKNDRRG